MGLYCVPTSVSCCDCHDLKVVGLDLKTAVLHLGAGLFESVLKN